ncbi:hypothetical protein BKP35_09035 [Anaerobacillus arseniciselenatis]|uniref:Protein kinase domain-containing protein n=2 Tax=Anaerobacillus arseniciselenatis TaxID=85682 RepID=A0A1S2LLH7_9BACI|nr:hypothetical protein BKP35_09035 [Anaerobacillus arseniciselenatis]
MEWTDRYNARKINEGAYGEILEINSDKTKVIKALHPNYSDREDLQRIQREIHCLGKLKDNSNVIDILDFNSNARLPWFVMPRATTNLHDYVLKQGALSDELTINITYSILNAMKDAHHNDILHRDLGASNILLFIKDEYIDVRVADFSLGRDFKKSTKPLTRSIHSRLGHDAFIAPEQYKSLSNATKLSDIYSIGALMLFMCTGDNPLRAITRPIESSLSNIISDLMQDNPNKRPGNIDEVINLLHRFQRLRNSRRVRSTFHEICNNFAAGQTMSEESFIDLTEYLTNKKRLYKGEKQGHLTYDEYFSPLLMAPPNLIATWVKEYAAPSNVDLFIDRYQEQLEQIMGQTRWTFRSMNSICHFLMSNFYYHDRLKAKIADMITNVYSRHFNEAHSSLLRIVTNEYDNERLVVNIAMAISKYSNHKIVKEFIDDNEPRIKHVAFIEAFSFEPIN